MFKSQKGSSKIGLLLLLLLPAIALTVYFSQQRSSFNSKAALINPDDYTASQLTQLGLVIDAQNCPGQYKLNLPAGTTGGKVHCTHGPDPVEGTGNLNPQPIKFSSLTEQKAMTTIQCDGDGVSGKRVEVIYLRASDVPDHYQQDWIDSYKAWTKTADEIFLLSAQQTNGYRRLRFVHDSNCQPIIRNEVVNPTQDDSYSAGIGALISRGYNRPDRKYLIFFDFNKPDICGGSSGPVDDSSSSSNKANLGPDWSVVYKTCWDENNLFRTGGVAAHELIHAFGGVQSSSPNSNKLGHCFDEYDRLCYSQKNAPPLQYLCTSSQNEYRLDCNHDDYFHTNPQTGTYLYDHWNTANNQFLISASSPTPPPAAANCSITNMGSNSIKVNDYVRFKINLTGSTLKSYSASGACSGVTGGSGDPTPLCGNVLGQSVSSCGGHTQAKSAGTCTIQAVLTDNTKCSPLQVTVTSPAPPPPPPPPPPSSNIQGFVWHDDEADLNARKNADSIEAPTTNVSLPLYKIKTDGSTELVARAKSNRDGQAKGKNYSFSKVKKGDYLFKKPTFTFPTTLLDLVKCSKVTKPKSAPTDNRYFYCQDTAGKLVLNKWTTGPNMRKVVANKIPFTGKVVNVDFPLAKP